MISNQKLFEIQGEAITNLYPNKVWSLCGALTWKEQDGQFVSDNLEWMDNSPYPSKTDIEQEIARLVDEWESTEYQRLRQPEYPSIGDQLDALWKGGDAAEEMLARVQAVKTKYPKPE